MKTPRSRSPNSAEGKPLKGVVDHAVPVLAVYGEQAQLQAILFGYACHPTTLAFTQWCGDYPGFAQIDLENNHPGVTAMFINTCGGRPEPDPALEPRAVRAVRPPCSQLPSRKFSSGP